jgi:threonine/homoserine/homoserine lactone efflux protein
MALLILAALFMLTQFKEFALFINILSLVGSLYLLWLSLKILKLKEINFSDSLDMSASLATAIKVNLLSPYPYLFWFTVGGAYLARGTQAESTTFVVMVLTTLVLSKMLIAVIASNFRSLLDSTAYLWLMRMLGGLLSIYGLLLFYQSYNGIFK